MAINTDTQKPSAKQSTMSKGRGYDLIMKTLGILETQSAYQS